MNKFKTLVSILIFISVLLSACASAATSIPTAVPVTPTAIPAMPTAIAPTPTSVPTSAQTTISPKIFKIPLSVTFGPDWRYNGSSADTIELLYRPSNLYVDFIIVDNVTLFIRGDPTTHIPFPDDFAGYLRSNDYFSEVTPNTPITLGGANGYQVDAIGKSFLPDRTGFLNFNTRAFQEFVYPESQKLRFLYFENISGKQLLIVIGSDYDVTSQNPLPIAQFDALMPKVQEVLDTVVFLKP